VKYEKKVGLKRSRVSGEHDMRVALKRGGAVQSIRKGLV
jgi:hypothetical protein